MQNLITKHRAGNQVSTTIDIENIKAVTNHYQSHTTMATI